MKITSPVNINGVLLAEYGCASPMTDDVNEFGLTRHSIPLEWKGEPTETKAFALVMIDYDNVEDEGVPWVHWTVSDIPAAVHHLEDDASRKDSSLIQGMNSFTLPYDFYLKIDNMYKYGYVGPAPERPHTYEITIYALDKVLELKKGFFYNQLREKMENHIIDEVTLKLIYYP